MMVPLDTVITLFTFMLHPIRTTLSLPFRILWDAVILSHSRYWYLLDLPHSSRPIRRFALDRIYVSLTFHRFLILLLATLLNGYGILEMVLLMIQFISPIIPTSVILI